MQIGFVHSPVSLDLKTREFSVRKYGTKTITFVDETKPTSNCMIEAHSLHKLMDKGFSLQVYFLVLSPKRHNKCKLW